MLAYNSSYEHSNANRSIKCFQGLHWLATPNYPACCRSMPWIARSYGFSIPPCRNSIDSDCVQPCETSMVKHILAEHAGYGFLVAALSNDNDSLVLVGSIQPPSSSSRAQRRHSQSIGISTDADWNPVSCSCHSMIQISISWRVQGNNLRL